MPGKEFFPHFSAEVSVRKVSFVSRFYIRFSSRRAVSVAGVGGGRKGDESAALERRHREKLLERNKRGKKGSREDQQKDEELGT